MLNFTKNHVRVVAVGRDWLVATELSASWKWPPGQLDDEVLERHASHLPGKRERIDSPPEPTRPAWKEPRSPMASRGMGMLS